MRKGTGRTLPKNARPDQLTYLPATKHSNIPILPKAVGKSPKVPLTSGWTVSPK
jgi:hypothetical protein